MAAFTVIGHVALTTATTEITFASISGSYDHLMMKTSTRSDQSLYFDQLKLRFNNSAGTAYSWTQLYGAGSNLLATGVSTAANGMDVAFSNGSLSTGDCFASTTYWIPNYANTANYKSVLTRNVMGSASTTNWQWLLFLGAGLWSNTAAIDKIDLFSSNGADQVQYSEVTLYGVSGA